MLQILVNLPIPFQPFSLGVKEKSKLLIDDDDVPLAQLKKARYGQKGFVSSLIRLRNGSIISH
jgi:hypothetical protein